MNTCLAFVYYTGKLSKSAALACEVGEAGDTDRAKAQRWDLITRFEMNFDHWYANILLVDAVNC